MTSSFEENRCKLLILDLNIDLISSNDVQVYFSRHGQIQAAEFYPRLSSAMLQFTDENIVDQLIRSRTCRINEHVIRLRRFRFDPINAHLDSYTLHVKLPDNDRILSDESLRQCFHHYQSSIRRLDVICTTQALISFRNYDCVDRILLQSSAMFVIDGVQLKFERILSKMPRLSRWDQPTMPLTVVPVLSVRNPILYQLISHIEYLTKRLRGNGANRTRPMFSQTLSYMVNTIRMFVFRSADGLSRKNRTT
jgi:hypothetical protein